MNAADGARPSRPLRLLAAWWPTLVVVAAVATWYWLRWPTLDAFVREIDYLDGFQKDFTDHYYPMSRAITAAAEPRPLPGYLYPAAFALLIRPIAALPPDAAANVWAVAQAVALLALVVLSARALRSFGPFATAGTALVVLTAVPTLSNTKWGQVSVGLVVLVLGAWLALRRGRPRLAGALLGVAAAVKLYPALFALLFVPRRAWSGLLAFVVTFAALYAALPAAVLGVGPWLDFEAAVLHGAAAVQQLANANSQSFAAVLDRWYYLAAEAAPPGWLTTTARIVGLVGAAGCALLAVRLHRRAGTIEAGLPLVALFCAVPLVVGSSWPHYLVFLPACQAAVAGYALGGFGGGPARALTSSLAVLAVAASTVLGSLSTFDWLGNWVYYNGYGILLVADLLVLTALVLAVAARGADRAEPNAPTAP